MGRNVRVYKPAKTAMQSGRAKTRTWIMEFEATVARHPDPLMGWISAAETATQVRLSFDSQEEALEYAAKHDLVATVQEPHAPTLKPKSYADNFRYDRLRH